MSSALNRRAVLYFLMILPSVVHGQAGRNKEPKSPQKKIKEYISTFQFSLFPGISTNGIESGSYHNKFSFNLFGGLSRGNRILELSPFSNATIRSVTGIQLGGLANIVGANAGISLNYFLHEAPEMVEDYKIRSVSVSFGRLLDYKADVWPGYEIGLHF